MWMRARALLQSRRGRMDRVARAPCHEPGLRRYCEIISIPFVKPIHVALAGLLLMAAIVPATAIEIFQIDPAQSKIDFQVHQFFGTVSGRFTQCSGTIELDREHPEKSSVNAAIRVKSIDTGITKRDAHLLSAEFFNAAQFPTITFQSRSVKRTGADRGDIVGDLTMHGMTRPITLHVKLLSQVGASDRIRRWQVTTAPLSRRAFGLRWSKTVEAISMIGDEIAINLDITAAEVR